MRYLVVVLFLAGCGSDSEVIPSDKPICFQGYPGEAPPTEPLSYDKCFGNFRGVIQKTDRGVPNYVDPRCPCAEFVPDAGR